MCDVGTKSIVYMLYYQTHFLPSLDNALTTLLTRDTDGRPRPTLLTALTCHTSHYTHTHIRHDSRPAVMRPLLLHVTPKLHTRHCSLHTVTAVLHMQVGRSLGPNLFHY